MITMIHRPSQQAIEIDEGQVTAPWSRSFTVLLRVIAADVMVGPSVPDLDQAIADAIAAATGAEIVTTTPPEQAQDDEDAVY